MVHAVVSNPPPAVDQGIQNACWLAGTTMLFEFKNQQSMSMDTVAANLGPPFSDPSLRTNGLPLNQVAALVSAAGFSTAPLMCLSATGWQDLINAHQPLMVIIDPTAGTGIMLHAVVVIGIDGDESGDGTNITFLDPNGAQTRTLSLSNFSTVFEAVAGTNLPFQIIFVP
jgi:ABC-type bacteriocin/lantibiotic exporter with double-glycine peptidase domain